MLDFLNSSVDLPVWIIISFVLIFICFVLELILKGRFLDENRGNDDKTE